MIRHENAHVQQHIAVRDNSPANNVWRQLDDFFAVFPRAPGTYYSGFIEVDGHFVELTDSSIGWFHLFPSPTQGDLTQFRRFYEIARDDQMRHLPHGSDVRDAARQFLQNLYIDLPFAEMKRPSYDFYVRPPE